MQYIVSAVEIVILSTLHDRDFNYVKLCYKYSLNKGYCSMFLGSWSEISCHLL